MRKKSGIIIICITHSTDMNATVLKELNYARKMYFHRSWMLRSKKIRYCTLVKRLRQYSAGLDDVPLSYSTGITSKY
jgi:hypothetical protein